MSPKVAINPFDLTKEFLEASYHALMHHKVEDMWQARVRFFPRSRVVFRLVPLLHMTIPE